MTLELRLYQILTWPNGSTGVGGMDGLLDLSSIDNSWIREVREHKNLATYLFIQCISSLIMDNVCLYIQVWNI
jgi:hypothetical protein